MKSLQKFMTESVSFNKAEVINDYNEVHNGFLSKKEKEALQRKYNADAARNREIELAILKAARDIRHTEKTYDDDDLRMFRALDIPSNYAKMKEMFDLEPKAFIEWYMQIRLERIKQAKLEKYIGWTTAQMKYTGLSYSYKSMLGNYNNIVKYLLEKDPENMKAADEHNSTIKVIINKLNEQTVEFKKMFIKRVKEAAEKMYKALPQNIEKLNHAISEGDKKLDELRKKGTKYWSYEYQVAYKQVDKDRSKRRLYKSILEKYTQAEYIDEAEKNGEISFKNNINALAERLNEKKLVVDKLDVQHISTDPKLFQLLITDGTQKLFARSIFAAEYSDKMVPHFRFIITNRK